jgi:hypothetical protein
MINFDPIFFCLDVVIFVGVIICVRLLRAIHRDTKRGADSLRNLERAWCEMEDKK